ncbi:hypothetical protein ACFQOZ_08385 [Comamonas endophytica]|uniref:hypothetical protein n=1 Tax=Comamonas endophytica TaxID=2949090 RepID=UPI0036178498
MKKRFFKGSAALRQPLRKQVFSAFEATPDGARTQRKNHREAAILGSRRIFVSSIGQKTMQYKYQYMRSMIEGCAKNRQKKPRGRGFEQGMKWLQAR